MGALRPARANRVWNYSRFQTRVVESTDRRSVLILVAGGYGRAQRLVTILVTTSVGQVVEHEVLVEVQETA